MRIRPAGVISKKDMGDRKIAVAILSCSFLDACYEFVSYICIPCLISLYKRVDKPRWSRISTGSASGPRSNQQSQHQRQSRCRCICLRWGCCRTWYSYRPSSSARHYHLKMIELVQSSENNGPSPQRATRKCFCSRRPAGGTHQFVLFVLQ